MQVFKLYFQVLRKYMFNFFLYIGIFCGMLFGFIIPANSKTQSDQYDATQCKYAMLDEDESVLSQGLKDYLNNKHILTEISDYEPTTLQDELYNRNIRAAVYIKKGFEEAFINGDDTSSYLIIYDIPDNTSCVLFSSDVNEYLRYTESYTKSGYNISEAIKKAVDITSISVPTKTLSDTSSAKSNIHYFYIYLPWIFVMMCTNAIAPVLIRLDDEEVRKRIQCSSFPFGRMNLEILLAILVTGAVLLTTVYALGSATVGSNSADNGILLLLNMMVFMIVAMSITFLVSKVVKNEMLISMISNVIGLGMAFLSGIFVPMELLSDGVIKLAHFIPAYWYVSALDKIEIYTDSAASYIGQCFGIQLLFAIALFVIGLVIANKNRKTR